MTATKADIIAKLERDILPLQGFKHSMQHTIPGMGLGPIKNAFPNNSFPLAAIHEFLYDSSESAAATTGFLSALLAAFTRNGGPIIWIGSGLRIFPAALHGFDIDPSRIIFIDLKKEKEILWALEESLACESIPAVVGELNDLSFTTSRRLQLAVEKSKSTGFILRKNSGKLSTTACIARWKITTLPGEVEEGMPGVGYPRWHVALLKVRNGTPGSWQVSFSEGRLQHETRLVPITRLLRKTG